MSIEKMDDVRATKFEKDEFKALPDQVQAELEAHRQQYLTDPVAAHMWDPIVIGTPGGPVMTLLLHHKGRKSGNWLNTALQYYRFNGDILIVASRGGTEGNPSWFLNLRDHPECRIQIGANGSTATARVIEGDARVPYWEHITTEQAAQAEYQTRTNRIIPVVALDLPGGIEL